MQFGLEKELSSTVNNWRLGALVGAGRQRYGASKTRVVDRNVFADLRRVQGGERRNSSGTHRRRFRRLVIQGI